MRRVRDFDTLVTTSEKEALILENNLIKQYQPRYNIRLKDDKSYLSAKVTNHPWPRITVTRKIVKDGGHYFGPFGSADGLRETIDIIRKVFPLRTCSDAVFRNRRRPCLEYQIKRCLGPCCLPVDRDEYGRHLRAATLLLEGKNLELLRELRELMKLHAATRSNSSTRRGCATRSARSRRPSSARPCCIIGEPTRTCSGFIARAALSKRSS